MKRNVVCSGTVGCLVLFFLLTGFGTVFAGGVSSREEQLESLVKQLMEQNRKLGSRLESVEKQLSVMRQEEKERVSEVLPARETEAQESHWYDRFSLGGGVTGLVMGTLGDADSMEGVRSTQDASYTMDLNLDTDFAKWGKVFVHLEGGDGDGLNNDVPSFSVPNYDAYKTATALDQSALTISEAFYEFSFSDDRYGFDIGKMDISVLFDENEVAGDETTQFLSNIFVKSMGMNIPEPDNFYCPAFMLRAQPVDLMEFKVIGASVNAHGEDSVWHNVFDDAMVAFQMNIMPRLLERDGNYRFYGWVDKRGYLKNKDISRASGLGHEDAARLADNSLSGWGLSFDQEILDGIKGFARYSQTITDDRAVWNGDEDAWEMAPFDRTWSVGFELAGGLWNRGDDAFGFAFGQTLLTDDYEDENDHTANENYLEAYYRLTMNQYFALSADFQWIGNAGGDSRRDDIYIWGLRSQIDF